MLSFLLGAGVSLTSPLGATGGWQNGNLVTIPGHVNLAATLGGSMYLTGVQLEMGAQATPFDRRPPALELLLCQRYCFVYAGANRVHSTAITNITDNDVTFAMPALPVALRPTPTNPLNAPMRTVSVRGSPTLRFDNGNGSALAWSDFTIAFTSPVPSILTPLSGVSLTLTKVAHGIPTLPGSTPRIALVTPTASDTIVLSAEF